MDACRLRHVLLTLVATGVTLGSCSPSRAGHDAARRAIQSAWRAFAIEQPAPDNTGSEAEARYDATGLEAIAAVDSARSALPPARAPEDHYFSATLGGLVSTLRDRHSAQMSLMRTGRENAEARDVGRMKDTYEAGLDLMKAYSVADGVAERTILRLAAWERRYLHETYLSDSYIGRLLAMVESQRVKGSPDSVLLHRPEIEGRIAWADSAMMAEIRYTR